MGSIIEILEHSNYVEETKRFEESIFSDVYYKAKSLVKDITEESQYMEERNIREKMGSLKKEGIDNMIAFIGERGSGKTTAMFSFLNYLNNYYQNRQSKERGPFAEIDLGDVDFHCLDYIDGGLLEQRDNILQILIGNLYRKFLAASEERFHDDWREYDIRELQEVFIRVENSIQKINSSMELGDSSIESLKNVSDSLGLKRELAELIEKYLQLMGNEIEQYNGHARRKALVIVIDDLDLNYEHGFEILESIHRYLMIPNVIVFISAEYKQLIHLCKKHFSEMYSYIERNSLSTLEKRDILKESDDYLDKIVPIHKRIYMRSLLNTSEKLVVNDEKLQLREPRTLPTIKEYIFACLYQKTRMLFDVCGEGKHYYEPNNLRKLNQFAMFMRGLNSIDFNLIEEVSVDKDEKKKERKNEIKKVQENYKELLKDFLGRKLESASEDDISRLIEKDMQLEVELAAKNLFKAILYQCENKLDYKETNKRSSFSNIVAEIKRSGYSYGNLLYLLFVCSENNILNKESIECILMYFTLRLNQRLYEDGKSEKKKYKEILNFMEGPFFDISVDEMLPVIKSYEIPQPGKGGMCFRKIGSLQLETEKTDQLDFTINIEDKNLHLINDIMNGIEIMLLFFVAKKEDKIEIDIEYRKGRAGNNEVSEGLELTIRYSLENVIHFNPWGFVNNLMQRENILDQFEESIKKEKNIICNADFNVDNSMQKEIKEWEKNYGRCALPVCNADLIFCIMEKLRTDTVKVIAEENIENLCIEINKLYSACAQWLEKEEEFIGNNGKIDDRSPKLKETLKECPAVKLFQKYCQQEWFQYIFRQFYTKVKGSSKINFSYCFTEEEPV